MKIGLYFGSFNPIHTGHLIVAEQARVQARLDRIWLVISPQSPFKKKEQLAPEYDRMRMVEAALEGNDRIQPSNVEFLLPKPSYTIDTLNHLRDKYPSYQFSLVMGADNLQQFTRWKAWESILEQYPIWVYPRGGKMPGSELDNHPSVHIFQAPLLDISATYIRQSIAQQQSIRYLVPDGTLEYIERTGLYR